MNTTKLSLAIESTKAIFNSLSARQQQHLENLISRYNKRTQTSKKLTQTYRSVLADARGAEGFNPVIKEMIYPIIGKRALGSKMWDVDDNEYIDVVMGFGVNLFGHNPPFIEEALKKRLEQGIHIGPQSDLAGEVAELISELTGMERVTFSNTGTEAVMTSLRIARAATGRSKIVMFSNSYHGHFDGTLAMADKKQGSPYTVPEAPGVLPNMIADIMVLNYGNPQSLEIIQAHRQELAAVIVEPVQMNRIDVQPKEFLQQLRQLTQKLGIVLIFDEMVTGFRIHPGGAQAWFGVEADIATYGKIVGGGMPIGVVAGKATYMDKIDGGMWNYGDQSYPQVEQTLFAGTYCKHPLSLAAARAALNYLKIQGPSLQQKLNQKTSHFVEQLNNYFVKDNLPIRMGNFGSAFHSIPPEISISSEDFEESENSAALESMNLSMALIYYHLINKGIYMEEEGGGLISTAHTDEDLNRIIEAVKDSITELREGEFLP
jgi:glutamate-1-semialdehyde 2,1-aminomutase